jgi:plastocyanin
MTFYLEGEDKPNPALKFRAGEEVRLVLRNDDPGMNHDFAVPSWNVGTSLLEGKGETTAVFRVPDAPGRQIYTCTPHSQMMRGTIDVE